MACKRFTGSTPVGSTFSFIFKETMKKMLAFLLVLMIASCRTQSGSVKPKVHSEKPDTLALLNGEVVDTIAFELEEDRPVMSVEIGSAGKQAGKPSPAKAVSHTGSRASAAPSSAAQAESSFTMDGTLVWTVPEKAKWGEVFEVVAFISKDTLVVTTTSGKKSVIKRIPVTPKMDVVLMSVQPDAVEISSNNVSSQIVEIGERTEWRWDCKAKKVGEVRLKLIVSKVEKDGIKSKVFEGSTRVSVAVGPMLSHFFEKNWQWIIATIVIPLLLWWWRTKKVDKRLKDWFGKLRG